MPGWLIEFYRLLIFNVPLKSFKAKKAWFMAEQKKAEDQKRRAHERKHALILARIAGHKRRAAARKKRARRAARNLKRAGREKPRRQVGMVIDGNCIEDLPPTSYDRMFGVDSKPECVFIPNQTTEAT